MDCNIKNETLCIVLYFICIVPVVSDWCFSDTAIL